MIKVMRKKSGFNLGGFTLVEIVIVMALMTILGSTGIAFGLDSYGRSVCHSERDATVAFLHRARAMAMNNLNKTSHGLHFENDKYVLFSGNSYKSNDPLNEIIPRTSSLTISLPNEQNEIIFGQLTGEVGGSMVGDIFIDSASSTCHELISLNKEGGIDW